MLIQPLTPEILEKRRAFRRSVGQWLLRMGRGVLRFGRKARRPLLWTFAVLFVAHSALNIYASVLLNRELAAIRQKGEPLQFAEMAPPAVPDAQNAALIYHQASKSVRLSAAENLAFTARESNRTPQMNRDIEAALQENQKALDLTRRAASMPKCRFPLDYGTKNPSTVLFPYYREMRELARLVSAQAQLEAKSNDRVAVLRDVRAIFGMANHLSNEPNLIGFLVAQAVDAYANQALARVLDTTPLTLAEALKFERSLPQTDWNHAYWHCLTGERTWSIFGFEILRHSDLGALAQLNNLSGGSEEDSEAKTGAPAWITYPLLLLWRPVLKLDEVQILRLWQRQIAAASSPQTSAFSNFSQTFDKEIEKLPRYAVLTRILMPVFSGTGYNRDRGEVRRRERDIALALAVYRTTNSSYPTQLSEIIGVQGKTLPLDPYSRKSFVYRRDGRSFILYSIGRNRTDDGGKDFDPQFRVPPRDYDDLVWGGWRSKATSPQ